MADKIVLVSIDTLRFDCVGYQKNKNELIKHDVLKFLDTPNLDNIAKKGICFTNAISVSTYTTSAHASILTGLYPPRHGVRAFYDTKLSENVSSLAEILKKDGYITILSTDVIELFQHLDLTRGFSHIFVRQDKELYDFLDKNKDKKIFLFAHFFDVHEPYLFSDYEIFHDYNSDYYDMIKFLYNKYNINVDISKDKPYELWNYMKDRIEKNIDTFLPFYIKGVTKFDHGRFKEFMGNLETSRYIKDCLLMIFSDHGEGRCSEDNMCIFSHGGLPYENVVRIPLIVYYNGIEPSIIDEQVSIVDIFPTILEKVSDKRIEDIISYSIDGKNLLSGNRHDYVQGEVWGSNFNFYATDKGLRIPDKSLEWYPQYSFVRIENRKYVMYTLKKKFIVFDLENDVEELNPIDVLKNHLYILEFFNYIINLEKFAVYSEKIFKGFDQNDEEKVKARLKKLGYFNEPMMAGGIKMEEKIEKTFEIKDIDINDIERQIREKIINRKKVGIYSEDLDIIKKPLLPLCDTPSHVPSQNEIVNNINSNWDIRAEYKISSHRPVIGRLLVWGRKLINNEVRRYVDILLGKQSEFNMNTVLTLKDFNIKINDIDNKVKDFNIKINDIDNKVKDFNKQKDAIIHDDTVNYFLFEDRNRGSIEEIKKKQSIYLAYFKNCQNVLDIGCGRGEFLALLRDNHICGKGIDIDEDMILYCKRNNLNVEKIGAIEFLQSLKNKSLDGIFSSQVIEHLQPNELINLIKLCHDKMQYDASIAIETINPSCLSAHITFYRDLSHIRLMHHETLKFILESIGFRNIEVKFLNTCPAENILDKYILNDKNGGNYKNENDKNIEIMNRNTDKLNSLLFGYQDYTVIAKK
jgi:arylsulfatase A-like enzyme/2-polyprenyl-3-methyl-5-hydroxy-6-metoxy-1,4-benzoquinol methylase